MELGEYEGPIPYREWLKLRAQFGLCCVDYIMQYLGCTDTCAHTDSPDTWAWHGSLDDLPTPETVLRYGPEPIEIHCHRGHLATTSEQLNDYFSRVHAMMRGELLPAEFDEEAERARLVAVER